MTPYRALFVDRDAGTLNAIASAMSSQGSRWSVTTARTPDEAISALAASSYDVVLSDLTVPGARGPTLLGEVRDAHPRVARVGLAGRGDEVLYAGHAAHQLIAKPCDVATLVDTLERTVHVQTLLQSEPMRRHIGTLESLPALPRNVVQLAELLARDDVPLDEAAARIEQDAGLSAKVLQLVSSPLFAGRRRIRNLREAVVRLGATVVRGLVLAFGVTQALECPGFDMEVFQTHATRCASIARGIAPSAADGTAFTAALLHDVGEIVLCLRMPEAFDELRQRAQRAQRKAFEVERELLGFTHGEVGAYLLGLWGFPWPIVDAVAFHDEAPRLGRPTFGAVDAVYVASTLLDAAERGGRLDPAGCFPPSYLETLGVTPHQLRDWGARVMSATPAV